MELSKKPAEEAGSFDLGSLIGQRKAFGVIAGRCSAAEAAAIRRIRNERLYEATKLPWTAFCPAHLGMCRKQADRLIHRLEEFGPDYFEVKQLTRIPEEAYRAIAASVKNGHIYWRNEAIALLPENSAKVAQAVAGLRAEADARTPSEPEKPPAGRFDALRARTDEVVSEWSRQVAGRVALPPAERQTLKNLIGKARHELQRLEYQVWG